MQDQSFSVVTEVCEANRSKQMQQETQDVCRLLFRILEMTLYLEFCVSQICGLRPVLGRVEDFSKALRALVIGKISCLLLSISDLLCIVYSADFIPFFLGGGYFNCSCGWASLLEIFDDAGPANCVIDVSGNVTK